MAAQLSTAPESLAHLAAAAWPLARIAEALYALARHSRLPVEAAEAPLLPETHPPGELHTWLDQAAARAGLQTDQVFLALDEIDDFLSRGAPALLRLTALEGSPLLALVGRRGRFVHALGPDWSIHPLPAAAVRDAVRQPFEAAIDEELDTILDRMSLKPRARSRARRAMMTDRLKLTRFRGCWILRLPPGARVNHVAGELGVTRRLLTVVAAHVAQSVLFVVSWWILGRAVLNGTVDRALLLGWLLLVVSSIPLRLLSSWSQGLAAISVGAWLRRRLLRGAFMVDRQDVRQRGSGQLFSLVVEAAAIDSLGFAGGLFAAFAFIELAIAAAVLWIGAGPLAAGLLGAWTALSVWFAGTYVARRQLWTTRRLNLTHHLLESMVGHRTRLAQQPVNERHRGEDNDLSDYIDQGTRMDQATLRMTALVPRGWLALAFCALTPLFVNRATSPDIAVAIGGILLAYRALQRLSGGLSHLAGAAISARTLAPLMRAASRREPTAMAVSTGTHSHEPAMTSDAVAIAQDVTFRYRPQGEPVLRACTLAIARNARLLLEGASGAGKTTLGSILAGLESPESGLVLLRGLDRSTLGAAAWRQHVVMAPQAHDNYIVGGSLAFNLLLGRRWPAERAELAEAEAVCRELGLGDLIDRLPAGLHQIVGETGWQLSQGERVRVFLARALLQRPDLLVLDESFSVLDPENLDRAARCIEKRASTTLAIAHF